MRTIEDSLLESFTGFRRIWVQYTKLNSLCITLFPIEQHSRYKIIVKKELKDLWIDKNLNINLIKKIIEEEIAT